MSASPLFSADISEVQLQKSPRDMLTPTWQMDVFIFETLILIPIYIFILLGFVVTRKRHKTFQSPYYTLMVSQVSEGKNNDAVHYKSK